MGLPGSYACSRSYGVFTLGFILIYLCTCRVRGLNVGRDLKNIDPSEVLGQVYGYYRFRDIELWPQIVIDLNSHC